MNKQPLLSLKALASELKHQVWEDRDACISCPNRQRDPNFGEYCESNSILDCNAEPCEVYQNYLEFWYSPDELEAFSTIPMRATQAFSDAYSHLNPSATHDEIITAVNQYQLIAQLQEQSSCK